MSDHILTPDEPIDAPACCVCGRSQHDCDDYDYVEVTGATETFYYCTVCWDKMPETPDPLVLHATPSTPHASGATYVQAPGEPIVQAPVRARITVDPDAPTTILDRARGFIERFVAFENPDHAHIIALWVLHTHAFDAAATTPYLYITSAEKQSGKTRTIECASLLSRNPETAANLSASSIFKLVEAIRPTLFIDEVDTIYSGAKNEDLRSILNSGYRYNGRVMRTIQSSLDDPTGGVRPYSTFCPKLLAGIDTGHLPETIADRCLRIVLKRAKADAGIERFVYRKAEQEAREIADEIAEWATVNTPGLIDAEPAPIEGMGDRAWDICEPLVAIAELLGVGEGTREALADLTRSEAPALSPGHTVLQAARDLFNETGTDRITNAMLAEASGYAAPKVGRLLSPYGIHTIAGRFGGKVTRVYYRATFVDAWERYL